MTKTYSQSASQQEKQANNNKTTSAVVKPPCGVRPFVLVRISSRSTGVQKLSLDGGGDLFTDLTVGCFFFFLSLLHFPRQLIISGLLQFFRGFLFMPAKKKIPFIYFISLFPFKTALLGQTLL